MSKTDPSLNFDDVFAEIIVPNPTWPMPYDSVGRINKGLRCKEENGWYLVGCTVANIAGSSNEGMDWDHGLYNNGCLTGASSNSGEFDSTARGGINIACMKITWQ